MNDKNKTKELLPLDEAVGIQRAVRDWLNTCPELPAGAVVSFEDLQENAAGFCVSSIQSPAYAARYILGGYKGEYRFRIISRVLPSDDSDMLDAVEALAVIAGWAEHAETAPQLEGAAGENVKRNTDVAVIAAYEDGTIDYAVDLTFSWEVF